MVLENCLSVCVEELFRICEGRLLNNVEAILGNKLSTSKVGKWVAESERRLKVDGGWTLSFR